MPRLQTQYTVRNYAGQIIAVYFPEPEPNYWLPEPDPFWNPDKYTFRGWRHDIELDVAVPAR